MKNRIKKITAVTLATAFVSSSISIAQAGVFKEYRTKDNDYVFKYDDSTGEIKSYALSYDYKNDTSPLSSLPSYDVVIPSVINGQEIKFIDYLGFFNDDKIKTFQLPSTLTSIGAKAFYGCDRLEEIDLSNVEEIGENSFYSCDALESVTIGDKITEIPSQAFMNNKKLKNVEFGENVDTIGSMAFSGCRSLETITLPENLKYISDGAFKNCTSLKSIDIPYGVTELEPNIFSGCSSLEYVTIPSSVTKINKNILEGCTSLKEIIVPSTCKDIDYSIFDYAPSDAVVVCEPGSRAYVIATKKGLKTSTQSERETVETTKKTTVTETTTEETTEVTTEVTTEATIEETTVATTQATADTNNQPIYLFVNGKQIDCGTAEPIIKNDRTLVPMRPLFEALDVPVKWIQATKTVVAKKDNTQVELTIGSRNVIVNGELITTEVAPEIINGYTYMPVRFLSESLGLRVEWDKESKSVIVKK